MRRIGWVLTLSVAAVGLGLWFAPLFVLLLSPLAGPAPSPPWRLLAIVAYELGLVAPAVVLSLAAQKLRWLPGHSGPLLLVISPTLGEWVVLRLAGGTPLAFTDSVALLTRVAATALALALVFSVQRGASARPF